MIIDVLVEKMLDVSFNAIKDIANGLLSPSGCKLITSRELIEDSLNIHLRSVKNWSGEVSFADLKRSKRTSDVFIELNLYVYPRRVRITTDENIESIPFHQIFDAGTNHIVLLGQPGAGKTTSMKYLCQLLLYDENFQSERFAFPILIKFRDLNNANISSDTLLISDVIYNILGLTIDWPAELKKDEAFSERKSIRERFVISVLEEFKVLLILDGFDELIQGRRRDIAIKEITSLAISLDQSTLIVTSRTGDFKYSIENAAQYEISPLGKDQIRFFARRWLSSDQKASEFLEKVYSTPFADTAIRPLTLAHLCAIYERTDSIPEKPKTVYKKIVHLLLEEWDQQRDVKRESKYAHFEVDRKYEFLCHLAYHLTTTLQVTTFSTQNLITAYESIYDEYGLVKQEVRQVVSEIETHTGLILQSGYEHFEFAHKSLQEFLTAEYLVKLPTIPNAWAILSKLPNELAVAIAISSSPSDYLSELVLSRFFIHTLTEDFLRTFLTRLLIEKPEFKVSVKLDLALILLYSRYIEDNVIEGHKPPSVVYPDHKDRLNRFYTDTVYDELKRIYDLLRKNSMDIILSCYEKHFTFEMPNGDHILRLISKSTDTTVYIPHEFRLLRNHFPRTIYVRESFINRFGPDSMRT